LTIDTDQLLDVTREEDLTPAIADETLIIITKRQFTAYWITLIATDRYFIYSVTPDVKVLAKGNTLIDYSDKRYIEVQCTIVKVL